MMRPHKAKCKKWCIDYAKCTKTNCDKKLLIHHDKLMYVDRDIFDHVRLQERKRAYKEPSFNTKVNVIY